MPNFASIKAERRARPQSSGPHPSPESGPALGWHETIALVRRHVWLICATIIGGTAGAAIAAFTLQEIYTASTTLAFARQDTQLSETAGELEGFEYTMTAVETEREIIASRLFARRVADAFELMNDPFFNASLRDPAADAQILSESTEAQARDRVISSYLSRLQVTRAVESWTITIRISHQNSARAATLADGIAELYVNLSLERKQQSIAAAISLLRQRVTKLTSEIVSREREIADYIRDNQLDVNRRDYSRDDTLRAEIAQLKARLKLSDTPRTETNGWTVSEDIDQIRSKLAALEQELENLTLADIRHRALEQELITDRERYNELVEQLITLESQADMQSPSARVISPAQVPLEPSFPKRKMIIAGGFVGSSMLSIMLAFLIDSLGTRIRSGERMEQMLGLRNFAYIPRLASSGGKHVSDPLSEMKQRSQSLFAEAVRTLFMACRVWNIDQTPQVIMLTSALPGEGKSTLASSLAVVARGLGKRTVLLDLDLHKCGVSEAIGADEHKARLASYLVGECNLADTVQRRPELRGLDLIAASKSRIPPSTLLSSDRLAEMFAELKSQYDVILVDTPAALVVNDVSFLAPLVDAAVLVIRWGQTKESALKDAAARLQINQVPLIGTVINAVEPRAQLRYGYGGSLAYYKEAEKYYSN